MKKKNRSELFFLLMIPLLMLGAAYAATAEVPSVVVLPFENSSGDSRSDYLGKIAEALLMYDLSATDEIELVSRSDLDAILREKQLALSGLLEQNSELREIGGLSGADFLIRGEYVHLGDDILFTLRLISVDSGEVTVYRVRGTDENTLHTIAEQLVGDLTNRTPSFTTEEGDRSIISMKNEDPGVLNIFSHLIDAEIFLDEEFVGYTTGDPTVPFTLDQVRPGPHTVRIHLSSNFGVVDLPEIRFRDWEKKVLIRPGTRSVVRDRSNHFNSILYDLQWVIREDHTFQSIEELRSFQTQHPFDFVDRNTTAHSGGLAIKLNENGQLQLSLELDEETRVLRLPLPTETARINDSITLELLTLKAEIERRYDRWDLDYSVTRNDVYQGMHRKR